MKNEIIKKKSDIIAELQSLGVEVNPGLKKQVLLDMLESRTAGVSSMGTAGVSLMGTSGVSSIGIASAPALRATEEKSDVQKILDAVSGLADRIGGIEKRVGRIEVGGKEDFKMDATSEEVLEASKGKEGIDPRIVRIVEDTLGIDFGIEIKGNKDRPGFELTVLVPKRLSNVPTSFRPVRDPITGAYKIDEKTKEVVEEEYWPGDRRSMQLGSTASYDMIQERCNRIRSFIMSWYQKTNKPMPELKIK